MSDKPTVEVIEDDAEGPDHSERVYDANDPEQVNLRRRKAGRVAHEKRKYIATVMADKAGRAWVHGLLAAAHVFQSSYVIGDVNTTIFREGERNLGLRILKEVTDGAPEFYATMMEEATNV